MSNSEIAVRFHSPRVLGAVMSLVMASGAGTGCPQSVEAPAPEATKKNTPAAKTPVRPPFPNMATSSWGQQVIEQRVDEADPALSGAGYAKALEAALAALHSLDAGSEERFGKAALAAFRAAQSDAERATGAALFAAALVLDPAPTGFRERLIDAHGVAAYAGQLEPGTVLSQMARAFAAIATGRVNEGKKLVEVVQSGLKMDPDSLLFVALSRYYLAERSDKLIDALQDVLKDKPESDRTRFLLTQTWLDLGFSHAVVEMLDRADTATNPRLQMVLGRARVLEGQTAQGIADLRASESRLPEAVRGTALYWLGRSLTSAGKTEEATEVLSSLSARPGYASEAELLHALIAQLRQDYASAKAHAEKVCSMRGVPLELALECQWMLVDACAGLGDAACLDNWGKRAKGSDGNLARFELARAALGLLNGSSGIDVFGALRRAHWLSPFDRDLGERVKQDVTGGGTELANLVRAARRALRFDAPRTTAKWLEQPVQQRRDCRVCRALFARATRDVDEAARRAALAIEGTGPRLDEADLLPLIDMLGASPLETSQRVLETLTKSQSAAVRDAATRSLREAKDPALRQQRLEAEKHGAREAEKAGTVPVPHLSHPSPAHDETAP